MKSSTDRIITTHVGSLPRPADLLDMMKAKLAGGAYDQNAYNARLRRHANTTPDSGAVVASGRKAGDKREYHGSS